MPLVIRPAKPADEPALGRMGAALARFHHAIDPRRFMLPPELETGYGWWLARERRRKKVVLLVAERDGTVVGYAYGRLEERDWNALRDACAVWHDVWVDEDARGCGVATKLGEEMIRRLAALGAPRIVLMTAAGNDVAQRLFARLGWRATMLEMTREL